MKSITDFDRMSALIDIIEDNDDWEKILSEKPYCLKIKKDPDFPYYMFSYDMIRSDMSLLPVQASRGCILDITKEDVFPVCWPFCKFFNYGEGHASPIDWSTAVVTEKLDGSLIKLWHDHRQNTNRWSTNNSFDCSGPLPESALNRDEKGNTMFNSFQSLIDSITLTEWEPGKAINPHTFNNNIKDYTAMFELCSQYNKVVVDHPEPTLYLIGARHNRTGVELSPEDASEKLGLNLPIPKTYMLNSLEQCIFTVSMFDKNNEGFVVRDADFNRIKVKGDAYLSVHRLKDSSGNMSSERLWECLLSGAADDVESNFPEYKPAIKMINDLYNNTIYCIEDEIKECDDKYEELSQQGYNDKLHKKMYAEFVMENWMRKHISNILFDFYKNRKEVSDVVLFIKKHIEKMTFEQLQNINQRLNDIPF